MKVVPFVLPLLLVTSAALALPKSVAEFRTRQDVEAVSPQGAARLWFDAVWVYLGGDTKLGAQLITVMMKDKQWPTAMPCLVDAMRLKPQILRSYVRGATPENGYVLSPDHYELNIRDLSLQPLPQFPVGKIVRLMLTSGGADAPRALDLERNGLGLYAVRDPRPLCLGIRPPMGTH